MLCYVMAMPVNMILVMYVILCILSYDFSKLTMLYIHVHISISMTNKSGLTFFLSIKYLSVCLYVEHMISPQKDIYVITPLANKGIMRHHHLYHISTSSISK